MNRSVLGRLVQQAETFFFGHRLHTLAAIAAFTAVMAVSAVQLRMTAGFDKQMPVGHEYTKTFEKYRDDLFGANRLNFVVKARTALNRRMEPAFVLFAAEYNMTGGDPSKMDLGKLKRDLEAEMDLYIINHSGVGEYTTYLPDQGLDFSVAIPYFYEYLMQIKDTDGFHPDRVVQEQATGQLKKFGYSQHRITNMFSNSA